MSNEHLHPERWDRKIDSRDINELMPTVRKMCADFLSECFGRGHDCLIVSTYRDPESQAYLWNHGLSKNAPNWSWHQYRCAFDIMVIRHGRPIGTESERDLECWARVGELGELVGLEWGGKLGNKDVAHFQHTFGRGIEDMTRGTSLPETLSGHINFLNGKDLSKWQTARASMAHWLMRKGEAMYYSATRTQYDILNKDGNHHGGLQQNR